MTNFAIAISNQNVYKLIKTKGNAMIADKDKQMIKELARKHSVSRVLLFGSSISEEELCSASDIDIAIEGIEDSEFYAFCGDVTIALSKPVDVVDISRKSKFSELVRKEGVDLYA